MNHLAVRAGAVLCLLFVCGRVLAVEPYQEYRKRIESAQTITALGDDLLGDSISLYNGATEFTATDIDIPGNNALPVRLARRFVMKIEPAGLTAYTPDLGGAANWDVEVPYISGMFSGQYGWGSTTTSTQRCSGMYQPSVPARWETMDFWQGYSVHIPGSGDRTMLMSEAQTPQPSDDQTHRWSTRERDAFTCIPMLSGLAGEGFSMTTASGVRYDFNVAVSRGAGVMTQSFVSDGSLPLTVSATRVKIFLLASKITDRFGNTVSLQYNADGNPTSITSNDGRSITLTYNNSRLATATAHGKTWQYQYGSAGVENGMLTTVVLPGSTSEAPNRWTYGYAGTLNPNYEPWDGGSNSSCSLKAPPIANEFDFTVTHPSGASGVFHFANKRHYRSGIHASECLERVAHGDDIISTYYYWVLHTPNYFDVMSLLSKTITGPGIQQPLVWTYDYGIAPQSLWGTNATAAPYPCTTCATEKEVVVINPDATANRYRYGFLYAANEGRLLGSSVIDSSGAVVRSQDTTYLADADAPNQAFFERYGIIINGDDPSTARVRPVIREEIAQDGATFTKQVESGCGGTGIYCFDLYGYPTKTTRFSSLGFSRTDTTTYFNQLTKWILGQAQTTTCVAPSSCAGLVEAQTNYDATTAAPLKTYAFGKVQQTLTYNSDGTVATMSNGRDGVDAETTVTLSSWKRGTPQLIKHPATPDSPNGATQAAEVNDDGTLAWVTDENGNKTCYGYDAAGRLSLIQYPSETTVGACDTNAPGSTVWNATSIIFAPVASSEYGIPPGHWKQVVSTGNARKAIYFDAFWRPLVEESYDNASPATTRSLTAKRYDLGGQLAFQSYPLSSLASYSDTTLKGTFTAYDALDRVTEVKQNSEHDATLGLLTTTTKYLTGFQTRVTNPRGFQTTTSYQAFDTPNTDAPVSIASPGSVTTTIARDVFGKPLTLTRTGSGN
jgi:YD repeat-containing protein